MLDRGKSHSRHFVTYENSLESNRNELNKRSAGKEKNGDRVGEVWVYRMDLFNFMLKRKRTD